MGEWKGNMVKGIHFPCLKVYIYMGWKKLKGTNPLSLGIIFSPQNPFFIPPKLEWNKVKEGN